MAYKVGWFSTGRDEAALKLLNAVQENRREGYLNIEIPFVFCNRTRKEGGYHDIFLGASESYSIPTTTLSSSNFRPGLRKKCRKKWRNQYHEKVMKALPETDLDILAGYMLVVSPEMCIKRDMINLHPALPGSYRGAWENVIQEVIENGDEEHGAMMHVVTPELDGGPPIAYCRFPLTGEYYGSLWEEFRKEHSGKGLTTGLREVPLFKQIRKEGERREIPLIIETVKKFANGEIFILAGEDGEKAVYDKSTGDLTPLDGGYDLTEEIDEAIGAVA